MKKNLIRISGLILGLMLTLSLFNCGGGGGGGVSTDSITTENNDDDTEITLTYEEITKGNSAFLNSVSSATIDNGSDYTDIYHSYIKLKNTDGTVKIEYDFVSDCSYIPLGGNGSYFFNNYIDANGVTINGNLNFYIVYNESINNFSYVFSGTLNFNGVVNYTIEYNYAFNYNGSSTTYEGYCKINEKYYSYNSDGTIANIALNIAPAFNPPERITSTGCDGTAPDTPTGLAVGSPAADNLTISWNAVTGASSYKLFYTTTSNGSFTQIGGDIIDLNYIHAGLTVNTTYYYKIVAHNVYGDSSLSSEVSGSTIAYGSLDTTFDPGSGVDNAINAVSIQSDNKIIIGGKFSTYNSINRKGIARINSDGSLDTTFDPGTGFILDFNNMMIHSILCLNDGKILVTGDFSTYNGVPCKSIIRLDSNGNIDTTFNSIITSGSVYSVAVQSDGKILIAGYFQTGTSNIYNMTRLNSDGSYDSTFTPIQVQAEFNKIVILPDGKIIVATHLNPYTNKSYVYRYNSDGSKDTGFAIFTSSSSYLFTGLCVLSDGKIIISGTGIIRLNSDGTQDTGFNSAQFNNSAFSMAIQSDGKIVAGGNFTSYGGTNINHILRLNLDGSLDSSFNPGTGPTNAISPYRYIHTLLIQPDGKIILGGDFTKYTNISRQCISRITSGL